MNQRNTHHQGFLGLAERVGRRIIGGFESAGGIAIMFWRAFYNIFLPPFEIKRSFQQMVRVGVESVPVVLLTAIFTGMVLTLQTTYQIAKFGAETYIGGVVGLSMTRELVPVLTGLMVAGRVGASIAAELGTMSVTEQIDALKTLATNPIRYLVTPRLVACLIMLPVLTAVADTVGIAGSYLVAVFHLGIPGGAYMKTLSMIVESFDVLTGLAKTIIFGGIIASVSCYYGFHTRGGAEGVGRSTTTSVVSSCITILLADVLLTALFTK